MNSASVAYFLYLVVALTAGLSIYRIIVRAPGRRLASDIATVGTLGGKTIMEIIRVAGPPTSSGSCPDGGQLLEWKARGYQIALLFDANRICQGESHGSPPKSDVARTGLTPVQPRIASKESPPTTIEKTSVNIPKESATVRTPTDFYESMTTPVRTKPTNSLETSPLAGTWNSPKIIAFQTIGKTQIDYQQSAGAPIQNVPVPKTPIVEARTDFTPPMTAPMEGPPKYLEQPMAHAMQNPSKKLQDIFCDNCGNSLKTEAKFCDRCGEAVTQQASLPNTEEQTTPPNDLQGLMLLIQQERIFRALADGKRRQMLDLLKEDPKTTAELCLHFRSLDRSTVTQHLGVLEKAGLVIVKREGRVRRNYLNVVPIIEIYQRWTSKTDQRQPNIPHVLLATGAIDH